MRLTFAACALAVGTANIVWFSGFNEERGAGSITEPSIVYRIYGVREWSTVGFDTKSL